MSRIKTLFALFLTLFALAAGAAELKEGREYNPIDPPVPGDAAGKIEVIEFFSYMCPHCFHFEPVLNKWSKGGAVAEGKDVVFRRVPVVFRDSWAPTAKIYYALEALGEVERMHLAAFEAIHNGRVDLNNEKVLEGWIGKKGLDAKKFMETYRSFTVQSKVARSKQMAEAYGIQGVPALTVDGRFRTSGSFAGSYDDLLKVVDGLIVKARKK